MRTDPLDPKKPLLPRAARWIAGGTIALGLAFAAGRFSTERTSAEGPRPVDAAARAPGDALPAAQPSAWARPDAPASVPAAGAPSFPAIPAPATAPGAQGRIARSTYRVPLSPERLELHKAEMVTSVEEQRKRVVQTCWPKEGLPKGRKSTTVTYNVTFDAEGREVGRGLVQDRRAPAGKFGKCLGRLQGCRSPSRRRAPT
jgi:hypothetical protein